ncbi:MAG TPA: L-seryl-tRNA(Sec) selenium transferase [Pyrinomonadaceae bacterium]|nr:L-seryl-tRNA(Sec) selenium transferase [Pyrinomonadaceae bacterium]
MAKTANAQVSSLRALPSVDQLLRTAEAQSWRSRVGDQRLTAIARLVTEELRSEIQSGLSNGSSREALLDRAVQKLSKACDADSSTRLKQVINATGVIIHTNLGRAPLSAEARDALAQAAGYCTLEYDQLTGERGRRGARVEDLLVELTGAEEALVVNNCAAAALLILSVLAGDGETIVSRGELVEIGGDFRVPDVMASSGTRMVEVGTTNRTKLEDYRRALNEKTRLVMRVHPSNYRIVGFTASPALDELASLAHEAGLPLYEDAGSGVLSDLSQFDLKDEPIIRESVASGADLVSFSGDKLLGASQAGLIVGKAEFVSRLRKHPLYRALRADKLALAVLERTLEAFRRGEAHQEVPVLRMLAMSKTEIEARAQTIIDRYQAARADSLQIKIQDGESAIGGGAGPNTHPATALLAVSHPNHSADQIESALRFSDPPIIARIADGHVLLDLRTVEPSQDDEILAALLSIL